MREKDIKREQAWIAEAARLAQENDRRLQDKATEFASLDKWYRDELAAEKERNRREVAELRDLHARELAKRDQAFKDQEDRFLAQLKELHERLARQEREHIEAMKRQRLAHE